MTIPRLVQVWKKFADARKYKRKDLLSYSLADKPIVKKGAMLELKRRYMKLDKKRFQERLIKQIKKSK